MYINSFLTYKTLLKKCAIVAGKMVRNSYISDVHIKIQYKI